MWHYKLKLYIVIPWRNSLLSQMNRWVLFAVLKSVPAPELESFLFSKYISMCKAAQLPGQNVIS